MQRIQTWGMHNMKPIFLILFLSSFVAVFFQNCSPASFSTDVHYLDEKLNKEGDDDRTPQSTPPATEQPPQVDDPGDTPPQTEDPGDTEPPKEEEPCDEEKPPGTPGDDDDDDGDHDPDDDAEKFSCGKDGKDHKVLICHVPSGNVENRHNICIAKSALKAHIAKHGDETITDYYGECKADEE